MAAICGVAGPGLGRILKVVRYAAGRAMRSGAKAIGPHDYRQVIG